jgi:hypothetical protein
MKCLKFTDQQACVEAFAPYLATDQTGDSHMPFYIGVSAVDVVGVIHKPTGEYTTTEDGFRIPVMQALDGWHVNLSGDCPADLAPFLVEVATPVRVFA